MEDNLNETNSNGPIEIAIYKFNSSTDTLPTFNSEFTYEYTDVDNSDGTITRTITSDSLPTSISFESKADLVSLSYLNTSNVTTMQYMFYNCNNLTSLDLSNFNTSSVTNMAYMFYGCNKLTTLDVSNFDTSNVNTMTHMFYNCTNLTELDLTNFDTNNVTNMMYMFYACNQLTSLDISDWDTGNVNTMRYMFDSCTNLTSLDLSNFNTSNVTDMRYMFNNCKSLTTLDISNFDTSKVTSMYYMFDNCTNLTTIEMNKSNYNSVNKILAVLPTRTADSMGTLKIVEIDDYSQIETTTAQSKFWKVIDYIIKHKEINITNPSSNSYNFKTNNGAIKMLIPYKSKKL